MKNIFKLLVLMMISISSFAGGELKIQDQVFPTSPDAAAYTKYVNVPIGKYTGTTDISIPLYEIKGRNLSLPMSLSYHPSGVKVAEESSCVGMGWSLNAGGLITRTVQGLPDDLPGGFLDQNGIGNDGVVVPTNINDSTEDWLDDLCTFDPFSLVDECEKLENNEIDGLPDIFQFNFDGYMGSFTIDQNNQEILITPHQNLKVDFEFKIDNGTEKYDIDEFTVISEDGTKYILVIQKEVVVFINKKENGS